MDGWVPNLPLDQLPSDTTQTERQTRHVPSRLILGGRGSFMALILPIDVAHLTTKRAYVVRLPNLAILNVERKLNLKVTLVTSFLILETPYIFSVT